MDKHIKALLKSNESYKEDNLEDEDKEIDLDLYATTGEIKEIKVAKEINKEKDDRSKVFKDTEIEVEDEHSGEFVKFDIKSLFRQDGESGAFQLVTGLTLLATVLIFLYNVIKIILKRVILEPTIVRTVEETNLLNLYVKLGTVEILLVLMFITTMLIPKKKIKKEERR